MAVIERVVTTAYGRPASLALARAVTAAKQRPLEPVTVIVPSNFAGLSARRLLGGGALELQGVANVNFFTPFRLAELLASGHLGARRPLTNPVLGAAVRRVLADSPRHFARVADHHATEAALSSLAGELANVSEGALRRIWARGGSSADAVDFYRDIRSHLADFHDEADVAKAAADRDDLAAALRPFGHLVWFLPGPTSAPLVEMLRRVLAAAPASVVVGRTGVLAADEPVDTICGSAGVDLETDTPAGGGIASVEIGPPHADLIVSVTDADEEVRAVVRRIVALAESGIPLDRIGVFHPTPDPYVRILEQQFDAAGLPANGPSRRRLAESVAGRTILGALSLPSQRWRRDRVMALVNAGPIRNGDEPVRPTVWETLSRDVGVVQGLADWTSKLEVRSRGLDRQRIDAGADDDERVLRIDREQADVEALGSFVSFLAAGVGRVEAAPSWAEKSAATMDLLRRLLGAGNSHGSWPDAEQSAFERVEAAIERLAALDEIEPLPSQAVFVRALTSEFDVARGRNGRFGDGVVYGPLSGSIGQDLDAVFILGCAEGVCPTPRRDDAMLPDEARRLANGELDLRLGQIGEQQRQFLAALAAAPAGRRTLLFPRGDLRGGRRSRPSRWLLESATALSGSAVYATDFDDRTPSMVEEVPSYAAGVVSTPVHASLDERDQAELAVARDAGLDVIELASAQPVRRGLVAQAGRASDAFTAWDGNVMGQPIGSTEQRPLSPTRLQNWAACGFRYFLGHVLELDDRDDPERMVELSALDRGSGVHEALERFFEEVIERGAPRPDEPWSIEDRARLQEIGEAVFDDLEARGRTGRTVRWRITRADLLALLDEFLDADELHRRTSGSSPIRVELPFGMDGADPVVLELGDGRTLRFRGKADRVDRRDDGHVFVSDYKTGKGAEYAKIHEGDPVRGGTTLQLGLYAEAARQLLGADDVDAHYWMVNTKVNHRREGYRWTGERRERMLSVLGTIAEGIEGGVFSAEPGEWDSFRGTHGNCVYCPFDVVCPTARGEQAVAKKNAPEIKLRDGLAFDADAVNRATSVEGEGRTAS